MLLGLVSHALGTANTVCKQVTGETITMDLNNAAMCTAVVTTAGAQKWKSEAAIKKAIQAVATIEEWTNVDVTLSCAASGGANKKLTIVYSVYAVIGSSIAPATIKSALTGKTDAAWGTDIATALNTVPEKTATVTTASPTSTGTITDTTNCGGIDYKVSAKFTQATASNECDKAYNAAAASGLGNTGSPKAVNTAAKTAITGTIFAQANTATGAAPSFVAGDVSYVTDPGCATADVLTVDYILTANKLQVATPSAVQTVLVAPETEGAADWCVKMRTLVDALGTGTNGQAILAGTLATTSVTAAAAVHQATKQTVTGSFALTAASAAECDQTKESGLNALIEQMAVWSTAPEAMLDVGVSCAAAKATVMYSYIAPVGTLVPAATFISKMTAVTAANLATQADTKVSAVANIDPTFTSPATDVVAPTAATYSATQAAATTITGSVQWDSPSRAFCETIKAATAITALKADLVTYTSAVAADTTVTVACDDKQTTMSYSIHVKASATTTSSMILMKLLAYGTTKWKTFVTTALGKATPVVTLTSVATTYVIVDAVAAATTTPKPTTTGTGTTTAMAYVAMSKIAGALEMTATESDCLNMKDPKGVAALATMFKSQSTAPTAATVSVTTDCTTVTTPKISYEINTPTAGDPTPAKIKTVIDGVALTAWETAIKAAIKGIRTGFTEPTITAGSLKVKTVSAISAITTTPGPTTTFTGSTTKGTTKEISGKLAVTVGSMAECQKMADANGVGALKGMLKTATGGIATTNMVVTVTCARRRRLSDGRRLATAVATVNYKITVPATSTITAAAAKTSLTNIDNVAWASKVKAALAAAPTPVNLTGVSVVKTDPTTTVIHNVSSALMWLVSPMAGLMVLLQFLC